MFNFKIGLNFLTILGIVINPELTAIAHLATMPKIHTTAIGIKFPPTGNRGKPKKTTSGGNRNDRDNCIVERGNRDFLIAMMPNRENKGKTTGKPNFYVYIPQSQAKTGELVLLDNNDREIYFGSFKIPARSGIVKLTLPSKIELRSGQTYTWSFMLVCDPQYRNRDRVVEGSIETIALDTALKGQLKTATIQEQAELYSRAGIWYETIDLVAQMRAKNWQQWQELLDSVGLDLLANEPFLDCCSWE